LFVALGIQHAKCMRHIVICGLSGSTVFSQLSHKWHDFRKKCYKSNMCILAFSATLFETFLILRRIKRDGSINVDRSVCEVPVILVRF